MTPGHSGHRKFGFYSKSVESHEGFSNRCNTINFMFFVCVLFVLITLAARRQGPSWKHREQLSRQEMRVPGLSWQEWEQRGKFFGRWG